MIVELSHGADGRARRAHGIGLIDCDRWRNPFDSIHRGFIHAIEELARVGGKGFNITPLPFCIHCIEGQGRLA